MKKLVNLSGLSLLILMSLFLINSCNFGGGILAGGLDFESANRGFPKSFGDENLVQGENFISGKKYKEAIQKFKKYLEKYPESSNGFYSLAKAYYLDQNYDEALKNINIAIEKLFPDIPDEEIKHSKYKNYYLLRGDIYFALKKYDEVIAEYNSVIIYILNNEYPTIKLGDAYLSKKVYDKALIEYQKEPIYLVNYIRIGDLYYEQKRYEEAIASYKSGFGFESYIRKFVPLPKPSITHDDEIKIFLNKANSFAGEKKYEEAIIEYKAGLKLKLEEEIELFKKACEFGNKICTWLSQNGY